MKGLSKISAGAAVLCLCMITGVLTVNAGTGIYVGKDVSVEGTTLIGVSTEADTGMASVPVVLDAGLIRKGDVIEASNGYSYELPEDSSKMTLVRMMGYTDYAGWTNCASNEHGVSVVTGITTDCNIEAQSADPFVYDGINEEVIAKVLCASSKTAKEAVDLLCSIYDEVGAETAEIVFIADPDGAWAVENFTGHQYVAAKLPDDRIATFSNDPIIKYADPDDSDTIVSENLLTIPEDNDFAVYDDDGNLDLILTYNYDNSYNDESHLRGWVGHDIFAPSEELDYDPQDGYDVFFAPDDKVAVEQAFAFFRNRFEGTAYDLRDEDNRVYYGINNQMVGNVNLVQIFDDVPAQISSVVWTTPSNPTASPFIPIPALADSLPDELSTDITDDAYTEGILQFDFAKLNSTIYPKREVYGASVRDYWEGMEAVSANDIAESVRGSWKDEYESSPEKVSVEINDFVKKTVSDSAKNCTRITDELDWYLFRSGVKSSSVPDEEIEPFNCGFDVEAYARANGWDTTVEDGILTAVKDGKKIEIVTEGEEKGSVTFKGFDNNKLIEDFMDGEEAADENTDTQASDDTKETAEDEEKAVTEEKGAADETEETSEDAEEIAEDAEKTSEDAEEISENAEEVIKKEEAVEEVTKAAAEQIEVDTIAALGEFFDEKIANIPRDGWAEGEIAKEISSVSKGVVDIIGKYFDGDIDKLIDMDYEKVGQEILTDEDVAKVGDQIVATGMDLSALLEKYFLSLYEDVSGDIESGRLTQQGAEKILVEAEGDIEGIATLYLEGVEGKFAEVFNTELSDEELEEIIRELGEGSLQIMEDYGGLDLDALGLGDIDINDLTEADIDVVITLNEMDDDVIDGLSELLGVDVRSTIDRYMDAINGSGSNIRIVEEDHENAEAKSAPDPIIMAAIEEQEELAGDDVIIPQEVIDVLNEAIIEAAEARGETVDESMLAASPDSGDSSIKDETEETADAAESIITEKTDDTKALETHVYGGDEYTAHIEGVKTSDGRIMLPAFMLKYFN
jgi:dipeptidase